MDVNLDRGYSSDRDLGGYKKMNRNRKVKVASLSLAAGIVMGSTAFATPAEATPNAGVAASISVNQEKANQNSYTTVSGIRGAISDITTEAIDTAVAKQEAQAKKIAKIGITNVSNYVNVRSGASQDSRVLGKLYSMNRADILGEKDGWYKIKSGGLEGYVKADYLTVGDEDAIAKASNKVAVVDANTLKIRSGASTDSNVLTSVVSGTKLTVKGDGETDGWVKVATEEGDAGYVSSDYVKVKTDYDYGETVEEEEKRLEEEAKAAAQEQAAADAVTAAEENAAKDDSISAETTPVASAEATAEETTADPKQEAASSAASGQTSVSADTVTAEEATAEQAQETEKSEEQTQAASGVGTSVAGFATQFVGNPYVWGGTSLTHGADCSGFVMSVYAHFGVSLPHSSGALRGVGRGVSTSEMQAGDIVCYSGHVGICIGNGQIVHASNHRDGIKISTAYYRNILAVRRIF